MLGGLEKEALMKLQYEFPLTPTPYSDVAGELGVGVGELIRVLRGLKARGVLKRVGFYYNPRSRGLRATLAAVSTRLPGEVSRLLASRLQVTHSYVRNHPVYNLWVVVRHREDRELVEALEEACREAGCGGYLLLPARRVYRLSVKYDLYQGLSRAGPYSRVVLNPPRPEELGVPRELPVMLRSLPLEPHPYRRAAEALGLGEEEVVEYARVLLDEGVLGDPGAALDGRAAGFSVNAMYVAESIPGVDACRWVEEHVPYATHIVSRDIIPGDAVWRYECFFMVHAVWLDRLGAVDRLLASAPVLRWDRLLSLTDLRPGVVR